MSYNIYMHTQNLSFCFVVALVLKLMKIQIFVLATGARAAQFYSNKSHAKRRHLQVESESCRADGQLTKHHWMARTCEYNVR